MKTISSTVIRELIQFSDDEDKDGFETLVYLPFNHLMWLVALVLLKHFTNVF